MSKRKKSNKILRGILLTAVILLVLELILVIWSEVLEPEPMGMPTEPTEQHPEPTEQYPATEAPSQTLPEIPETTVPTTAADSLPEMVEWADGRIPTPYLELEYPEAFEDLLAVVNTAREPYTLEFYAMLEGKPEQRIFDIRLSEKTSGNLGVVQTERGEVSVSVTFYRFSPDESWTEDEINTVLAMQEAANDMIARLELQQDFTGETRPAPKETQPMIQETAPESNVVNMLSVDTPFVKLYFPVRWKDNLVTEQEENPETGVYCVRFYGQVAGREKCLLFTILFGGDEGEQLGVVPLEDGSYVPVNLIFADPDLKGWNPEEEQCIFAMQEAVNELIGQLPLE